MTTEERVIAGFPAVLSALDVGGETIALWQVADLERHVDRHALLAGDDPPEPEEGLPVTVHLVEIAWR